MISQYVVLVSHNTCGVLIKGLLKELPNDIFIKPKGTVRLSRADTRGEYLSFHPAFVNAGISIEDYTNQECEDFNPYKRIPIRSVEKVLNLHQDRRNRRSISIVR